MTEFFMVIALEKEGNVKKLTKRGTWNSGLGLI